MITKAEAIAYREYYEDQAALFDRMIKTLESPLARYAASRVRDHCYLDAVVYGRLERSWFRRLFSKAPE